MANGTKSRFCETFTTGGGNHHSPIKINRKILAILSTLFLVFFTNLYAYTLPTYELDAICQPNTDCIIDNKYSGDIHFKPSTLKLKKLDIDYMFNVITNEGLIEIDSGINFHRGTGTLNNKGTIITTSGIVIAPKDTETDKNIIAPLGILYNYGTISANGAFVTIKDKGYLTVLFNYGTINGYIDTKAGGTLGHINNYGTMNGIIQANKIQANNVEPTNITNFGTINRVNGQAYHLGGKGEFSIKKYAMKIMENAEVFNQYKGNKTSDNSHIVVEQGTTLKFYSGGKLILGFGGDFEYDTEYSLRKLVVDTSGNNVLGVDLANLELLNKDIFTLMQSGDSFIVSLGGSGGGSSITTPITATSKANIATMNNLFQASNALMSGNRNLAKSHKMASVKPQFRPIKSKSYLANVTKFMPDSADLPLDSATATFAESSLKQHETFFYERQNLAQDSAPLAQDSQNLDKYSFLLTPFINHTYFYKSGNYSISGLDYGFVSAFSGKLNESNTLGAHFAFSYGSLSDREDRDFKSTNMSFMLGLNYRLDMIWDMFLKARGDFYYFLNEVGASGKATKPSNLGFGLSVSYGKDFDLGSAGVIGAEVGLDYKMLNTGRVDVASGESSQQYKNALYNMIYADLGLNYHKYFSVESGIWGIDGGIGMRGNLTPKISSGTLMVGNRAVDIMLDNDKILAYLSLGSSYVIDSAKWAMEFSLRYNGSYGDRSVSNGGSFEWRALW